MNKNYFCRFFKEKAGKTPFAYLNEYRINQAAGELMKTDLPITEVALNAGAVPLLYSVRNGIDLISLLYRKAGIQ